jgi:hypothetical protein
MIDKTYQNKLFYSSSFSPFLLEEKDGRALCLGFILEVAYPCAGLGYLP